MQRELQLLLVGTELATAASHASFNFQDLYYTQLALILCAQQSFVLNPLLAQALCLRTVTPFASEDSG